jgi:hypothetical protein
MQTRPFDLAVRFLFLGRLLLSLSFMVQIGAFIGSSQYFYSAKKKKNQMLLQSATVVHVM